MGTVSFEDNCSHWATTQLRYSYKYKILELMIILFTLVTPTPISAVISSSNSHLNPTPTQTEPHYLQSSKKSDDFHRKYKYGEVIELPETISGNPSNVQLKIQSSNSHRHHTPEQKGNTETQGKYFRAFEWEREDPTLNSSSQYYHNLTETLTKTKKINLTLTKDVENNLQLGLSRRPRSTMSNFTYQHKNYKCKSEQEKEHESKIETYSTFYEYLTFSGAHSFNDTITIAFLSPYNQNPFSLGAMRLAVERVNNESILPGRTLQFIAADIGNSELMATSLPIRMMTQMRDRGAIAFIGGPEDTCQAEALVASAWNLPMISYKCSDHRVSDKAIYPTFARTLPPSSKVSKAVVGLLKHFKWDQIVLVVCPSKRDREFGVLIEAFKVLAQKHSINITDHHNLPDYIPENFPEMVKIVEKTYERTRVYVFIGEHVALVHLVRAMATRGLFDLGEYVVISVDDKRNLTKFFEVDYLDSFLINGTIDMMKAFRSVLKLIPSHPQTKDFAEIEQVVTNYSTAFPFCVPFHPLISATSEVPVEAAYLYDAVMIYAEALRDALLNGKDPRNGTAIFQKIKNRYYRSIQGYYVLIDENGDAEGNYTVISMLPIEDPTSSSGPPVTPSTSPAPAFSAWTNLLHSSETRGREGFRSSHSEGEWVSSSYNYIDPVKNVTVRMSMQPVGYFQQVISSSWNGDDIAVFQYFNESRPIQWVAGYAPRTEPNCGFDNEKCETKPDLRIVVVSCVFASIFMVAVILAARHYRYEQKLACLLWKIDMKDVIIIPMGPPEPSNGTKSTVALCRQLLGAAVDTDAPLELACKKAYTRIGFYKGMVVATKPMYKKSIDLTRNIRKELKQIRELRHENIIPFIGASVDNGNICILTAYSARGSLEDVLQNEDLHLDNMFLASLVFDLIKGMIYLHDSEIISHGNLKSSNCLVDSRWVLQISDFGLHEFKAGQEIRRDIGSRIREERKLLWKAPELLRDVNQQPRGSQKGDVYSFGIILYEMIGRSGPWGKTGLTVSEIIAKVAHPKDNVYLRPPTQHLDVSDTILKCMLACWEEDPELRPDFRFVRVRLKEMQTGLKPNIFDNMLSIMEKYACNLEDLVQDRTTQLIEEKRKTDALLHRMLPKSVAESLKRGAPVEAESFDSVTIYFSDIVGFTELSAISTPMEVVELLNDLYTCFDSIISNYDVYKVETIGDAYMVSGLPIRNGNQHAGEVASMSLHLLDRIRNFEIRHRPGERLKLRIGIHSGPVVSGVVGLKMPRYCLFGDTVNTASRMESSGEALKIHISDITKTVLQSLGGYYYTERGIIPIKGKGEMRTFWLTGEDPSKSRRNSTEADQLPANSNNNYTECTCECGGGAGAGESGQNMRNTNNLALDVNGVMIGEHANNLSNVRLFKPTTWLLAECNNGKLENGNVKKSVGIGGRYVSCSNVFQECKASIIKELKKTGSVSSHQSNRFRSAPIITFIDTSNPYTGTPGFPYEEPKFV